MNAAATPSTARPNRLARTMGQLDRVPAAVRPWARNLVLRRAVPFTGTAGLQYLELTPQRVEVAVANQRRVQNHIHGVHAAAMTLLAETATGMVVGMNVRDDCLPLAKELRVAFKRRARAPCAQWPRSPMSSVRSCSKATRAKSPWPCR